MPARRVVAAIAAVVAAAPSIAAATAAPAAGAGEWEPFDPGPGAVCADGSEVHYLQRVADPTSVVLYFEGGGACFSASTCAFEGHDKSYVSSSRVTPEWLEDRGGVFDLAHDQNPLAGHSFVYVPYCTGDVHLGNRTTTYADGLVVEHRGYPNALLALEHLVDTFPDAAELVVAGSSAGSVPTPLFAALAADRLPETRIVTLGDSSGAYPDDPVLNAAVGSLWGSMEARPDWPELEGVTVREWGIPALYRFAGAHAPDVEFAKFDHAFDEVQAWYGELVGVEADELVTLIDEVEMEIEASGTAVASYVAPGTAHTILGSDELYDLEVEGVRLIDWLTELTDGRAPADVHCSDCR